MFSMWSNTIEINHNVCHSVWYLCQYTLTGQIKGRSQPQKISVILYASKEVSCTSLSNMERKVSWSLTIVIMARLFRNPDWRYHYTFLGMLHLWLIGPHYFDEVHTWYIRMIELTQPSAMSFTSFSDAMHLIATRWMHIKMPRQFFSVGSYPLRLWKCLSASCI